MYKLNLVPTQKEVKNHQNGHEEAMGMHQTRDQNAFARVFSFWGEN